MVFLQNKTALVSGAAQGLGYEIAWQLASNGCHLFLCDLQSEKLVQTHAEIQKAHPGTRVHQLAGDICDASFLERLEQQVDEAFGGSLDILVNNVEVVFGGAFLSRPMAEHRKTYEINTLSLVEMSHRFLPRLLKSPEARLVNVSSATSFVGLPYGSTYASSKWAVTGISESLRLELKQLGHSHIRVKIVCPSYIATGMFDGTRPPLFMPSLEPKSLATRIVRFLPGKSVYLKAPFMVHTVRFLQGLLPLWVNDWILHSLGITSSMSTWHGHKNSKNKGQQ